jgi:superfamily II DNA or RNA helicase
MVAYDSVCTIVIEGSDARIEGLVPWNVVIDVTSYYAMGYQFSPRFRMKQWDGRIKLFRLSKRTFPSGLVQDVKKALEETGIRVRIDEKRMMPALPALSADWKKGIELEGVSFDYPYDYQPEVAEKMIQAQRGVVAIATNGGKTELSCLVTAALRLPTLFLVPGKELLHQTAKRFDKRLRLSGNDPCGVVGDSLWKEGSWITVASVPTLFQNLSKERTRKLLSRSQLLFCDECHHGASDSFYLVLRACNAFFRYGMSGTPLKRTDGADLRLIGATGPLIAEIRNKELIRRGISNKVEIHIVPIYEPDIDPGCAYQDVYQMGIVDNPYRNRILCKKVEEFVLQKKNVVVLVRELQHGFRLDENLWKYCKFVPHQFINGKETSEIRQKALSSFEKGELPVLMGTSILDEGIDLPNIDVIVLAGGGKSSIKSLQRIGRGIRKGGTSDTLIVVDTADFQHEYLTKHSLQRLEDYKAEDCFRIIRAN